MPSRFSHVVTTDFLILNDQIILHCVYYYSLFIYLSTNEHKCFCVLAIINNAVINIEVQTSFRVSDFISFGYIPRRRIAGSHNSSILIFLRNFHTAFHNGYTSLHSYQQMRMGSPFSTTSFVISPF